MESKWFINRIITAISGSEYLNQTFSCCGREGESLKQPTDSTRVPGSAVSLVTFRLKPSAKPVVKSRGS